MTLLNFRYLIVSAMFLVTTRIELFSQMLGKPLLFDFVTSGAIYSSWKQQTSTCELTFAKRLFFNGRKLQDILKAGDKVLVKTGYDFRYKEEFAGYLTRFNARIPLTIYFDDCMWLLKQGSITQSFGVNANLKDVAGHLAGYYNGIFNAGIKVVAENAQLGSFAVKDLSGNRILEKLRERYGVISYFRANTLYIGFAYQVEKKQAQAVNFEFQRNIISDNLEYRTAEDLKIRVKAISYTAANKKIIAFGGDNDGEVHTIHLPIGMQRADVEQFAEREAKKLRYNGYHGQFTAFHLPVVEHGDIVELTDREFPERGGRFFVDATTLSFGVNGIRRIIEPGRRA